MRLAPMVRVTEETRLNKTQQLDDTLGEEVTRILTYSLIFKTIIKAFPLRKIDKCFLYCFLAPLCHLAAELFKCRLVRRRRRRRRRQL